MAAQYDVNLEKCALLKCLCGSAFAAGQVFCRHRRLHSCIHVSTSRLMWSFHSNVRHTHRFEAEGDTGVNSQVHMRPKAHPVCLKAQRFVVILSAHK